MMTIVGRSAIGRNALFPPPADPGRPGRRARQRLRRWSFGVTRPVRRVMMAERSPAGRRGEWDAMTDHDEVSRRVALAQEGGGEELDLSDLDLTQVPAAVHGFKELRTLDLSSNRLSSLPEEIGDLTELRSLNLDDNELTALPASIGRLTALERLDADGNRLSALPPEIGRLTALVILYAQRNRLTALPPEISGLTALSELILQGNRISALPREIGDLTALTILRLEGNRLDGLPAEIGRLTALVELDLSGNSVSTLPKEFGNLTGLDVLGLSANGLLALPDAVADLSGLRTLYVASNRLETFPETIGGLRNLDTLNLYDNALTALPDAIARCTALRHLDVDGNRLRSLPAAIGRLKELTTLYAQRNQLSTLPREIGGLTALTELSLSDNELTALPVELGGLVNLRRLQLSGNRLSALPREIGDLAALAVLNVAGNQLAALPESIGGLRNLAELNVSLNELGTLPETIRGLTALTELNVSTNRLSVLPDTVAGLRDLAELNVSDNQLSTLPEAIGDLTALTALNLDENQLTTLPESIGRLSLLERLDADGNQLTALPESIGRLKALTTLYAQRNQFTVLPDAIGKLTALTDLYLSGNQLRALPPTVGGLTALSGLDLSNNKFSSLPDVIGGLSGLVTLDLSGNAFTTCPEVVGDLTRLTELNLSLNELGTLPETIRGLTALVNLNLSGNLFTELPEAIGALTALTALNLDENRLTTLPESIGRLSLLERLDADGNDLSTLPAAIGRLQALNTLYLQNNAFTTFPEEITKLTALTALALAENELPTLPAAIGGLKALTMLQLRDNRLTALPEEIGELAGLVRLDLVGNRLSTLPVAFGRLAGVAHLYLSSNRFTELPEAIAGLGRLEELLLDDNEISVIPDFVLQLTSLSVLSVRGNRIISPPPAIVAGGTVSVLTFLRARRDGASEQWVSKLLIVGEGGVGKTSLLKALAGMPHDHAEPSTHGLRIERLNIPHPSRADVDMHLSVWDFGGQEIYHATHQFFLTDRSLFLLAWNSRLGWEQGRLQYWLDIITARAPESPILLIATHADQGDRPVDLPLDELRAQYPRIVAGLSVDSETRQGIEALRGELREQAANLPLMGSEWPTTWQAAAEELRAIEDKHITPERMWAVMDRAGVGDPIQQQYVAVMLHQLGDILYYHDDPNLAQSVILRPEWVNAYISKVLDSDEVAARNGVLTREHLSFLWSDLDRGLRHHFLDMMDKYDLSYQMEGNDGTDLSLVVERLGWNPPPYQHLWDGGASGPSKEIRVLYELNSMPPGIPTWFIARSHRFTTHHHWRTGALLRHPDGRHVALVRADRHRNLVELAVRGPLPTAFFSLLDDGLNRTLERFPGLSIKRLIPCPCGTGTDVACAERFDYEDLQRRLLLNPPREQIECRKSLELLNVKSLLLGLAPPERSVSREDIERITELVLAQGEKIDGQTEFMQRMFVRTQRIAQAYREILCPSVFTLVELRRKALTGAAYELRLYCEEPGAWHRLPGNDGCYKLDEPPEWLVTIAPYLKHLLNVLKHAAPFAGPILGMSVDHLSQQTKAEADAMKELIAQIPDLAIERRELSEAGGPEAHATLEADFRALEALLVKYDPKRAWGGLSRTTTPEGLTLYLCAEHSRAYRGSVKVDLDASSAAGHRPGSRDPGRAALQDGRPTAGSTPWPS
ncbi:leucine-rich repeat domain-containing protein [Nonomuraea sp. NPDC001636]|uniref:leucine-rich repeat domain-containing protein n=1 Tax=Nonomuraea sp. NPDC001636 TaxID=3154391 RepID=UPI00331AF162